ncbi:fatty acid oxidation complex subunit alpha [Plakobranchus ocellatus]|uniref:Fatty acid oxidation complex subunit alpha n=1 Tax=Plakobranchus ocellatus TaxID=259542 RepID=A0AAV4AAG1_9GAST|nr:fatty acid oxidation complex subunit alpha [Plakobranchus ocellatus]
MVLIAVVGAGMMGIKIAGELAYHGHRVKIHDSNLSSLNKVHEVLNYDLKQLRAEGLISQAQFLGQVFCMSLLEEAVKDAELIIEAVIEDLEVKKELFHYIAQNCKSDAVIASNTMCLDINDINSKTAHKERTLGLRFLFPVYYIPEVEICPAKVTTTGVIERVRRMVEKMGKTLFFRSGQQPLVLSEQQREDRKIARQKEMLLTSGIGEYRERTVPGLRHKGNEDVEKMHKEEGVIPSDLDRDCAICMERVRDCLLQPCHHMVTCFPCGQMLQDRRDACPICRKNIEQTIKVFHT